MRPGQLCADGAPITGEPYCIDDFGDLVRTGVAAAQEHDGSWRLRSNVWGARRGQLLTAAAGSDVPTLQFATGRRGRFAIYAGIYTPGRPPFDNDWINWSGKRRSGIYLRVAGARSFQLVLAQRNEPAFEQVWCGTFELDGAPIEVAAFDLNVWLDYLLLVPVGPPPALERQPLVGIVDFADDAELSEPAGFEAGSCVLRHAELGYDTLMWKAYAVRCEYPTRVGEQRRYSYWDAPAELIPADVPPEPGRRTFGVGGLLLDYDTLAQAVATARAAGTRLFGWVRIANESSKPLWEQFGGTPFHQANPEAVQHSKDGSATGRLSIAYPEVVAHKVAIVREIASYGVDGILIDVLRHPPMVDYELPIVAAFRAATGVDPLTEEHDVSEQWLRFRAGYFTRFLEAVRAALRADRGESCQLWVRTVDQPWRNLQVGCDVDAWLDGGLLDGIIFGPHCALHDSYPEHIDLGGYVRAAAGRTPIYGQVWRYSAAALAERLAADFHRQGVAGVAVYESNLAIADPAMRASAWRLAHPAALADLPAALPQPEPPPSGHQHAVPGGEAAVQR